MEENKKKNEPGKKNEQTGKDKKKKGGIHNNALYAAGMGRSATQQVDPHTNRGLADTGTNISYEGATAPGSGGSVGSGYSSGKSAVEPGTTIRSDDEAPRTDSKKNKDASTAGNEHDEEKDII